MKVLELEIWNVRGIRSLSLKPNGKNLVVWGPNGSGKSAVVDAIDFLLTGRISRLTGKGTGGITLNRHGPHIDSEPKEAKVEALIQLSFHKDPIRIRRCMANPDILECADNLKSCVEPIIWLAKRGQHVLTRREILKYIAAEAGTRAQEIQELLNISEIEDIRKCLVRVQHDLDEEFKASQKAVNNAKAAINATVQQKTYSEGAILEFVNRNRALVGGEPVRVASRTALKTGLTSPARISGMASTTNITLLESDIKNLNAVMLPQNQAEVATIDKQLRDSTASVRSDPQVMHILSCLPLINLGLPLIDDTGKCPLCNYPWPPGKLREDLEKRANAAGTAVQQQRKVDNFAHTISIGVSSTIASLEKTLQAAQLVGTEEGYVTLLKSWLADLQELYKALSAPIEKYPTPHFTSEQVSRMLAPANLTEGLDRIYGLAKEKYPETTPQQNAWDALTRLEENLKALDKATAELTNSQLSQGRASILLDCFVRARDDVLGRLYDTVRDRFVDLYRQLHGIDEDKFAAEIKPSGAGLDFEVDFYGRGVHPPHALHSEGHQDSMGLCLYLALAERLTAGLIDLVILDDVVMSVDADHRRQVCRLLSVSFPTRQFLITTHDRTWAKQIKSEGIVDSKGIIEFYNWNVDSGPQWAYEVDMWERIDEDIQKNDIPRAAGRLRRGLEQFFADVCDTLRAPVVYKSNGRWELGDFLPAAIGQYRSLLKHAKQSANSWNDVEKLEMFNELESVMCTISRRTTAEQWALNANVHYNNWYNFTKNDFQPVAEAFHDLCNVFLCSECGSMLSLAAVNEEPVAIRCNCGKVNWNLTIKPKN
ncbi:MAG: AAA family ATPase [Chloroflexi bacterium]|nr:AAA family ATPase [Chloroflexota bacterium]